MLPCYFFFLLHIEICMVLDHCLDLKKQNKTKQRGRILLVEVLVTNRSHGRKINWLVGISIIAKAKR